MTASSLIEFKKAIEAFAEAVKQISGAAIRAEAHPEEQLKAPLIRLLQRVGSILNLQVHVVPEVQVSPLRVRPDLGVLVNGLITGHIELKAPGKGADPSKFTGHDREQWRKLRNLPNLIYTDGNAWALYRNGERQGPIVRFAGDVTTEGRQALDPHATQKIYKLFQDFLSLLGWNVMPTARNARGIDIVAYSRDGKRFIGIQVKSLSKRAPVPLGRTLDNLMGDFWVIVNRVVSEPTAFILTPEEVRQLAHRGEKDGRVSYWLWPSAYEKDEFRNAWYRIGRGDEEA